MKVPILVLGAVVLAGCATTARQTDAFLKKPHMLPRSHVIEGVPFVEQTAGHCGPATLTMALNWAGKKITVDEAASQVFTPGAQGSFQADMISASRRNGMLALPIEGVDALLAEVAAGHPVIVFENLALSWMPRWHYALVLGYDLRVPELILHSGPHANHRENMREFEQSWEMGKYWGLVILPPGKLATTPSELAHVKAAAALEQGGFLSEALVSYKKILQRWPESLGANIGAANAAFKKKDISTAVTYLRTATRAHPLSAAAWHNLALALGAANDASGARSSAQTALRLATDAEKPAFNESLKDWLR